MKNKLNQEESFFIKYKHSRLKINHPEVINFSEWFQ
ncbi:hypothetical protein J2W48_001814 [Flavobacterium piscis]|uniref:Uncharacterized protein n=1 Tax=Flavobacterium piscis TaxID=1114874 RepID=A0ABU1Y8B3_9FLAO|nr:hypothetical protein [Flavobacterium piscis]